jgi:hypothetical protein
MDALRKLEISSEISEFIDKLRNMPQQKNIQNIQNIQNILENNIKVLLLNPIIHNFIQ